MNINKPEFGSTNEHLDLDPEILKKVDEGNSFAQLDAGKALYSSSNQNYNMKQAFYWFTLSAKQGNMEAQFRLGDMYALGDGTEKSEFVAYDWYLKSALQGYPKALTRLHNLYHAEKSMYCRGQRNSKEEKWTTAYFKKENNIRELYEYRVQQLESKLTKIKEYFTKLLSSCREIIADDEQNDKQDAYLILGFLYQHGYGIRKIKSRAIEFYTLAAEKENADAAYNLGHIYHHSLKIKWNYREAFKWYTKAVENGHIYAHNGLAFLYLKGLGTDINYSKAIDLYTKAAEGRNISAMISLAKIFRQGEIVEKDYEYSAEWYRKAAIEGSTVAQSSLELLCINKGFSATENSMHFENESLKTHSKRGLVSRLRSDISTFNGSVDIEKLKKLAMNAMKGDGYAMFEIGMKYYNGDDLAQDEDTAFKWIRNAAKSGIAEIQCAIAKMYKYGDCVKQDYLKASIWYEKVAKKGNDYAQYNLGLLYYHGLGVRKDPLEASRWFTFAANKNNSDAQCQLGILRENGEGLRQNFSDALTWFTTSAKQNNSDAVYRLALIHEKGIVEKSSFESALTLYEKAANLGSLDAQLILADLFHKEESQHYNKKTAFRYFRMAANQGGPEDKYKLAIKFLDGKGVRQNFIWAFYLFRKSSDLGYENSTNIFNIQIDYPKIGDIDYNKVADMFKIVSGRGVRLLKNRLKYRHEMSILELEWRKRAAKKKFREAHYETVTGHEEANFGTFAKNKILINNRFPKTVEDYKSAHRFGNTDSTYKLACMHLNGHGVSQSFQKAFILFVEASNRGHIEAYKILNLLESSDTNVENDLIQKMFEVSAKSGNVISQYKVGVLTLKEGNSEQHTQKAIKWFDIASKGGFIEASYRLALLLENTIETERVIRLYQAAGDKGHKMALFRLAQIHHTGDKVETDYSKAYEFYVLAAQQGYQPAQLATNTTTESIWKDNKKQLKNDWEALHLDYESCFRMWEHMADEGDIGLQYKLGIIYEQNGGDSNMVQAAKWYSKAAGGSHSDALYNLGKLYDTGLGVDRDHRKAIELYKRCSDLNNYQALYQLGVIYEDGKGVKPDFETAHYYYRRSAKKGNSAAQFALGRFYEEGKYLPRNNLEALKWYSLSASQGNKNAESYLTTRYDDTYDSTLFYSRKFRLFTRIAKLYHLSDRKNDSFLRSLNYELGYMHHYGYGTPVDYKETWEYYRKASALYGDESAREMLTIKYENIDISTKDKYLKKLEMFEGVTEQLSIEDIYELGSIFYHGVYSYSNYSQNDKRQVIVRPDYYKSLKYLRIIAERDLPVKDYYKYCSYYLGMIFFVDIKHTNDSSKAQYYFVKALNSGVSNAQPFLDYINDENANKLDEAILFEEAFKWHEENQSRTSAKIILNIGWMYDKGLGTQKDYEKAIYYYKILTESDYTDHCLKSRHDYSNKNKLEESYATYIDWYTKAANKSQEIANYNIGNIYFKKKDYQLAFQHYKAAADQENSNAHFQIGLLYDKGYGIKQNYAMAIKWYTKAAEQSHTIANCNLGNLYFFGKGVKQDYESALRYYKIAANQGNSDAQSQLGVLYEEGNGTEQDHIAAIEWYTKAVNQSQPIASYNLGNLYRKVKRNTKIALQYFKDAAVQGDTYIQHKLVYTYMQIIGIAVELFDKITINHLSPVSNESNNAIVMLGGLYHSINSATRSFSKALHCYKNTSENSIYWSYALRGIGLLYEHGDGVERSYEKAFEYYSQSANRQNKGAYYNVALFYYYGKKVEKNYAVALDWFKRVVEVEPDENNAYVLIRVKKTTKHNTPAAKKKEYSMVSETVICREAHHYLSLMYNQGQGTDKDYEKALYHFKIATSKEVKRC